MKKINEAKIKFPKDRTELIKKAISIEETCTSVNPIINTNVHTIRFAVGFRNGTWIVETIIVEDENKTLTSAQAIEKAEEELKEHIQKYQMPKYEDNVAFTNFLSYSCGIYTELSKRKQSKVNDFL